MFKNVYSEILEIYKELTPNSNLKTDVLEKLQKIIQEWEGTDWAKFEIDEEVECYDTRSEFTYKILDLIFPMYIDEYDKIYTSKGSLDLTIDEILRHPDTPNYD
jgi:hypothetical protein